MSRNRKANYINGLITSQPKATQRLRYCGQTSRNRRFVATNFYHLKIHGEMKAICKTCLYKYLVSLPEEM